MMLILNAAKVLFATSMVTAYSTNHILCPKTCDKKTVLCDRACDNYTWLQPQERIYVIGITDLF